MSEYLDAAGVEKIWQKVKDRSVPVKTLTQAQYDALSYEERAEDILYVTNPLGTPSSAPAADVPIGAVIAVMGKMAPRDYLICDGAEHSVEAYPDLAGYFIEQFGTVNHFGGDGTTTFAVPDLRNLFLRGYHGEAEEQLSGEIGEKQEGTEHTELFLTGNKATGAIYSTSISGNTTPKNMDSIRVPATNYNYLVPPSGNVGSIANISDGEVAALYTSHPVNAAVLYCIKASIPDANVLDVYSEKEQVVGKWIDGKLIYRVTKTGTNGANGLALAEGVDKVINVYGTASSSTIIQNIPDYASSATQAVLRLNNGTITFSSVGYNSYSIIITVEYTKTSDTGSEVT